MKHVLAAVKSGIKKSGLLPSFKVRERLAARYLHGEGLEIGALNFPLRVAPGVGVKYVDYATREENIRKFPELAASLIVNTDHIENGFELSGFGDRSQDFIVANHVLEHADNPIGVLLNWKRLLKPAGVLMVTVPVGERCFDRGRAETTLSHLVEDYLLTLEGELDRLRARNREHFAEIVRISEPADLKHKGVRVPEATPEAIDGRIEEMLAAERPDIHYHTFSIESYGRFMEYFVAEFAPDLDAIEICRSRGGAEVVAILKIMK